MKISTVIAALQEEQRLHGDIEVYLVDNGVGFELFYIVAEEYRQEDGGWAVNLRSWPY